MVSMTLFDGRISSRMKQSACVFGSGIAVGLVTVLAIAHHCSSISNDAIKQILNSMGDGLIIPERNVVNRTTGEEIGLIPSHTIPYPDWVLSLMNTASSLPRSLFIILSIRGALFTTVVSFVLSLAFAMYVREQNPSQQKFQDREMHGTNEGIDQTPLIDLESGGYYTAH